jgi:hypothetical protein
VAAPTSSSSAPHVTLHLWRVPRRAVPAAVARMAVDRRHLRRTAGLRFAKLLGTGDGRTFLPGDADVRTWGLLGVWDGAGAALDFEAGPTARGWRRIADEEWRADLACLRTRGAWARRTPFTPRGELAGWGGPVASITRARLRLRTARTFWRDVPAVVADLAAGPAPLLRLGIGEAPVGLQGTLTVWSNAADLAAFAHRRAPHRRAVARTAEVGWYAEELFARFAVLAARGTVGGAPLEVAARA